MIRMLLMVLQIDLEKEADQYYNRSIDLMKTRYDKSFKVAQYSIGDIVGVVGTIAIYEERYRKQIACSSNWVSRDRWFYLLLSWL